MSPAQNIRIAKIAEGREIDARNELPTRACEDHNFVRAILPDAIERVYEFGMVLRRECHWTASAVKLGGQDTIIITRQLEAAVSIKIFVSKWLHFALLKNRLHRAGLFR
jgi:hypothetical protein